MDGSGWDFCCEYPEMREVVKKRKMNDRRLAAGDSSPLSRLRYHALWLRLFVEATGRKTDHPFSSSIFFFLSALLRTIVSQPSQDTSDSPPVHEIILSDRSESDSPDPYVGLPPMSPEQRGTFDSWSPQKQANYRQEWLQNAQQQSGQGQVDSRVMTPVRGEFGVGAVNGGSHPQVQMEVDEQPTVRDAEAFAAKHMPDLGQEVEDFKVHTWRIKNWQAQDKRIVSDSFEAGGHKWRILLFPYGNASGSTNDMTSIYLDYADPTGQKEGWHACAQFALAISNPNDPSIYTVSREYIPKRSKHILAQLLTPFLPLRSPSSLSYACD